MEQRDSSNIKVAAEQIKKVVVERPDLNNLDPWLEKNVTEPFEGFSDLPDGETKKAQLNATHRQLKNLVNQHKEDAWPDIEIQDQLIDIITPDSLDIAKSDKPT